jgi:hypothetical protein
MAECCEGAVQEAVQAAIESRAAIEQAKGMLMLTYGITAAQAFDILRWQSQTTNTRLRTLAAQVVVDFSANLQVPDGFRERADHLLLTAHERAPTDEAPTQPPTPLTVRGAAAKSGRKKSPPARGRGQ